MRRIAIDVRLGLPLPFLLMPTSSENPRPRLRGPHRGFDLFDDVVPRFGGAEIEHHLRLAEADEMAVPLDEAGDHELAVEAQDFGGIADERGHIAIIADSN